MKSLLFLAGLMAVSCNSYIQIIDTQSADCKTEGDSFYFENDSLKITCNFWSAHGNMTFDIYNKSNKPLYIHWKNSSYILNGVKYDYWTDEENTMTEAITIGYSGGGFYSGNPRFGAAESASFSSAVSKTTRLEKVTFLPPKSVVKKVSFAIMSQEVFEFSKNAMSTKVPYSIRPKKQTTVLEDHYTSENTPMMFRNYLAVSGSEESVKFDFVDNQFYVASVREMTLKHFRGKSYINENSEQVFEKKDKKPTSFYVYVLQN